MKKIVAGIVLLCLSSAQAVVIIGHRGAAAYAPENTISSFARAIELKVDMIECDVWKCASGELIVFHDAKIDRVTDGHGHVALKTLHELKQFTVLEYELIPTLEEVVDFVDRRVKICVELKGADIAHDIVQLIEHYVECRQWQYGDFLVASFDHVQLQNVKAANRFIPVAALVYGIPINFSSSVIAAEACVVCLDVEFINQRCVDDIHDRGMHVYVYTVNDEVDFDRVMSYGVDGIITDCPAYISMLFSSKLALCFNSSW